MATGQNLATHQISGLNAGSDISEKQFYAMMLSSDGAVDLATTQAGFIGILLDKPDEVGSGCRLAGIGSVAPAYVGGTVVAGTKGMIDTADGMLITCTPGSLSCCTFLEAGTVGAVVSVLVEPSVVYQPHPGSITGLLAGSDMSTAGQGLAVAIAADGAVDVAGDNLAVIGILLNSPDVGEECVIAGPGHKCQAYAAGTFAAGDCLSVAASDGQLQEASNAEWLFAYALSAGTADALAWVLPVSSYAVADMSTMGGAAN